MGTQLPQKGAQDPPLFGPYLLFQTAGWIKMPLGTDPAPHAKGHVSPKYRSGFTDAGGLRMQTGPVCNVGVLWPKGWK